MPNDRFAPKGTTQTSASHTDADVSVRILSTTDLHMHALAYDYYNDRPNDAVGLARVASLIRIARSEVENCLLFDGGDTLQGTPLGDYLVRQQGKPDAPPHPFVAAMNAVGYDAATVGNHEFNYGLPFLLQAFRDAAFPVVLGNMAYARRARSPKQPSAPFPPYTILERVFRDAAGRQRTCRVGVLGLTPPQVMQWDAGHLKNRVTASDMVSTAKTLVPELRARGADIVVLLAHSGLEDGSETPENASLALAHLPGVDVILTGHSHLVFPSPDFQHLSDADLDGGLIAGKPVVMAGQWGKALGVVDLVLRQTEDGWTVQHARSHIRPVATKDAGGRTVPLVTDAPEVVAPVKAAHDATLRDIRRPVGKTSAPLHSYFAMVSDCAALQLVAEAQSWYVARALDGRPEAELPLVSSVSPFKAGGRGGPQYYTDIAAGPLALRHVAELYVFPNRVAALRVTGADLREWLELSSAAYHTIAPGAQDADLFVTNFPSYRFDALYGVSYRIDVTQPPRFDPHGHMLDPKSGRIVDLCHQGCPVPDDMEFVLVTNSYRAGQTLGTGRAGVPVTLPRRMNRDVLRDFVAAHCPWSAQHDPQWHLAPAPGTSVTFLTGPGAAAHATASGLSLDPLGENADGFAQYRLHL